MSAPAHSAGGWGGAPDRAAKRPAALFRRDGDARDPRIGRDVPELRAVPTPLVALRPNIPGRPGLAATRPPVGRDGPRRAITTRDVEARSTETDASGDPRVAWSYANERETAAHRAREATRHEAAGWQRLREGEHWSALADSARPTDAQLERLARLERRAGLPVGGGRKWLDERAREAELAHRRREARSKLPRVEADELETLDRLAEPWLAAVAAAARCHTGAARHAHRAVAHVDRWAKLGACGASWELRAQCATHGELDHAVPVRCGHVRLCVECRGRRAQLMRARVRSFVEAAANPSNALAIVRRAEWSAGEVPRRGVVELLAAAANAPARDRWSLRFVTLTLPHTNARRDVRAALDCWAGLVRRLRRHYKARGHDSIGYVRVLEVTPGTDAGGHAHVHALMWAPFLRGELLRVWWGAELRRRGYAVPMVSTAAVLAGAVPGCTTAGGASRRLDELRGCSTGSAADPWPKGVEVAPSLAEWRGRRWAFPASVPWPVVDVRTVVKKPTSDGHISQADVADELVKYLVKDLGPVQDDGSRERAAPDLMRQVYEATEGRRLIVAASGAWAIAAVVEGPRQVCICDECGALPQWRATRLVHVLDARGPPRR